MSERLGEWSTPVTAVRRKAEPSVPRRWAGEISPRPSTRLVLSSSSLAPPGGGRRDLAKVHRHDDGAAAARDAGEDAREEEEQDRRRAPASRARVLLPPTCRGGACREGVCREGGGGCADECGDGVQAAVVEEEGTPPPAVGEVGCRGRADEGTEAEDRHD